jgi:hypothetical protein
LESEGQSVDVDDDDTLKTYPVNKIDADPNMKQLKNITDFK